MTVGSALHTKGCLKANNNAPPPRGATGHAGPKEAKTIGLKDFHEANPPTLGSKGTQKEEMKEEQPIHVAPHHEETQAEEKQTKSEAKKERETMDRHVPRHGVVDHVHQKKHQIVQDELIAADARANDILDELHEEDKREMEKKEDKEDNEKKTTYAEYEKQVEKKEDEVAPLSQVDERKVSAPAMKEMQKGDEKDEEYMKVDQQRNDYTNKCLDESLKQNQKHASGGVNSTAGTKSQS